MFKGLYDTSTTVRQDMQVLDIPDKKYWANPNALSPSDLLGGGGVSQGGGAGNTRGSQKPRQQVDTLQPIQPNILEPTLDKVLEEIIKRRDKKAERLKESGRKTAQYLDELLLTAKAPQEDQGWQEKYDKDVWSRTLPFGEQIVDRRNNMTHTIPSPFLPALVGNPLTLNNPALKGLPFWARVGIGAGEKFLRALRDLPMIPPGGGGNKEPACKVINDVYGRKIEICRKGEISIKGNINGRNANGQPQGKGLQHRSKWIRNINRSWNH